MTEQRLLRVDTHRVVMVLYGLCGSARAGLVFEAHPEAAGVVVARFGGRNGGTGQVAIPDQAALRATLDWLAAHPRAEVVLRAVLAAVRATDGVVGGWATERVLELLWGPRKPGQSRARKLPPVRALIELLAVATWLLDAPVAQRPAPAKRKGDVARQRARSGYGGSFSGYLLSLDPESRTMRLNAELRQVLDAGPYDLRPADMFALPRTGHTNPRGRMPSLAAVWLMVHNAWDYARFRQNEALRRDGAVQAVAVEDFLARWTSVDLDGIRRRRLMPVFVDRLEHELAGGGEVALAGPIERHHQPGRCQLRLRIVGRTRPGAAVSSQRDHLGGGRRRRGDDRRPPVSSTPTGTATSTGPPRA
jgi:hypothetical protein